MMDRLARTRHGFAYVTAIPTGDGVAVSIAWTPGAARLDAELGPGRGLRPSVKIASPKPSRHETDRLAWLMARLLGIQSRLVELGLDEPAPEDADAVGHVIAEQLSRDVVTRQ